MKDNNDLYPNVLAGDCAPEKFEETARNMIEAVKFISVSCPLVKGAFSVYGVKFWVDKDTTYEQLHTQFLNKIATKIV